MKTVADQLNLSATNLPYHNGIIMSCNAVPLFFAKLKEEHQIEFVLTRRLNQDVLEQFFGLIRSVEGLHDDPHVLEFMHRFKRLMLSSNTELISKSRLPRNKGKTKPPEIAKPTQSMLGQMH
uniref:Transposable element P transposase-like RNase H C-terminal domain-containing protein n=1 Tax=Lutzomyia longipalpis TaxID=7200 RepID=A0A1B0GH84_LUTLO